PVCPNAARPDYALVSHVAIAELVLINFSLIRSVIRESLPMNATSSWKMCRIPRTSSRCATPSTKRVPLQSLLQRLPNILQTRHPMGPLVPRPSNPTRSRRLPRRTRQTKPRTAMQTLRTFRVLRPSRDATTTWKKMAPQVASRHPQGVAKANQSPTLHRHQNPSQMTFREALNPSMARRLSVARRRSQRQKREPPLLWQRTATSQKSPRYWTNTPKA
ncbi:unnamed protein product, partial [Ixodes pacificus]